MNNTPMTQTTPNPFFAPYVTPFDTLPFDQIRTNHYEPAFEEGIRQLKNETETIASHPDTPTFENTLAALERSGKLLENVSSAFFNVLNAEATDEMMDISQRISPLLTESSNAIYLNEQLFNRIQTLYKQKEQLNLSTEASKLLEETYEAFKVRGATLAPADKETYRQLSTQLNQLTLTFEQNALKDKNRFELLLSEEDELAGLPPSIREAAALKAKEKGKTGWLFTLSAPSYIPFMRYSDRRDLREKMYRAYTAIGNNDNEYDNKTIIRDIVNTRLAIARLMGYPTYAAYRLTHTMAKTPQRVYQLLDQLLEAYKPAALREYATLEGFAAGTTQENIRLMPWDWNYYAEKLKDIRFHINDEMTRPYFELENVRQNVFGLATQLYGLTFRKNDAIPVYHPEVEAYEVYDKDSSFLAILYTDFHPRDGKQSGAWMNNIRSQYKDAEGSDHRPHIIIVMNFSRPTETQPSLLTFDEVNTLLHEFGHALHGMLAAGTYASLSGTSVYRDFVELPSQLMENWLTEKAFLDQIAVHYQTGEKIPEETIRQLIDAANFNAGYLCCRQVSFGLLDMAWHTLTKPFSGDVSTFEKNAWAPAALLPEIPESLMSSNFSHIFSGGYAAGYYGYKWAEVLDADAFAAFKAAGIFNRETADAFRQHILSKGGIEDPAVLYKRFRGQEPTIEALLARSGIKKPS